MSAYEKFNIYFKDDRRGNFLNVIFHLVILLTTHKPPIFITYFLNTINYSISQVKSAIFSYLDFSICLPLKKNMAKQVRFFYSIMQKNVQQYKHIEFLLLSRYYLMIKYDLLKLYVLQSLYILQSHYLYSHFLYFRHTSLTKSVIK